MFLVNAAKLPTIMSRILVLVVALVSVQIVAGQQSLAVLSSSGTIKSSTSGLILYRESFETAALGWFNLANQSIISSIGWGPDMGEGAEVGDSYGEVQNKVVQHGQQAVMVYAPIFQNAHVYSNIAWNARLAIGRQGFSEFYVRWYEMLETLPLQNWRYISLARISHGTHETETGCVDIIRLNDVPHVRMRKMWGNITEQIVPYPFSVDTWYKFELYYKYGVTDGEYRLLINGEEIITVTGQDTTPRILGVKQTDPAYLPKGWDGGIENLDHTQDYYGYLDNFLFADYRVPSNWTPPETATVGIQILNNQTKNYVPRTPVKLDSYEGYTNESGFVVFTEIPTSLYTLSISNPGYRTLTEQVSIYTDRDLKFYLQPIAAAIFEIYAYVDLTEIVCTVEVFNSSGVVATVETPYTLELNPGTYTLKAAYEEQTLTETWIALEGETSSIKFQFKGKNLGTLPFEFKVVTLVFIVIIAIAGATLISKRFSI